MIATIVKYIFIVIGLILIYEIIRALIKGKIIKRLNKSVRTFIESYNIKLDKYKFMSKIMVKQELMNDGEIHQAIIEYAEENGLRISDVQNEVEEYIEEIVPFFNLLSYYKFGYKVANFILNLIYEVVIDHENAEKLKNIPPDNAVVFVMNHRSNIDYIIVAYMLAKNISLSYAVGEWARVWPLEYIFKSFGAYFIRRKFRKKLYHFVLEKYIQLISLQGVTQGVFIEGGLTRNGILREPKLGILDYIIKIKENNKFKKDIIFIPVGINYDWVLEDRSLIQEWKHKKEKSGFKDNLLSLIRISLKGPLLVLINLFRLLTGKLKQHGYASVSFGDPVPVSKFLKSQKGDIFKLERYDRLSRVKIFADKLLEQIGDVIPVTPVCLTAKALTLMKKNPVKKASLIKKIIELRKILKENGRRIVFGEVFESSFQSFQHLMDEKDDRQKELVTFEEEFLNADDAQKTVEIALELMKRRKMIKIKKDNIYINRKMLPLLEYYSNSLNQHIK